MKTISYTISPEFDEIELHILADLHLGDKHCRMDDIQKQIDRIKDTENAFLILNGDIVNWASKTSISDCYAEELTPMEQIKRFSDLFEPVKDKIVAVTQGNHEGRIYRTEGVDLTWRVSLIRISTYTATHTCRWHFGKAFSVCACTIRAYRRLTGFLSTRLLRWITAVTERRRSISQRPQKRLF